ncbi:MAG: hypothetical protein ABIL14_02900 [candidate division WOR-3 bacterium]
MNALLLSLISASVFAIEGFGEERAIFQQTFLGDLKTARIEFTLNPEFNLISEEKKFRCLFWTNPFYLSLKVPVYKGLSLSLGNLERFNQVYDIYSERELLKIYTKSRGGIEEVYLQVNQWLNFTEIFFRGSFLFGSSFEVWNYTIGDYTIADTFSYKYKGQIYSAGLKVLFLTVYYEGLGSIDMERSSGDTTYKLAQVIGFGLEKDVNTWDYSLSLEHSVWIDRNINRIRLMVEKDIYSFSYNYNPWYLKEIKEHRIGLGMGIPFKNLGKISFDFNGAIRTKGNLWEFVISPQLRLTLEEIFSRRKK